MDYVVHYSIGSALFLVITSLYFFLTRRMPSGQNKIFSIMLIAGITSVVFDALAALLDGILPAWALYTFNIIFLLSMHLCLPLFCSYLFVSAGRYRVMPYWKKLLTALPFAIILVLTLSSPLWEGGIFYIDANGLYQKGLTHPALYFVSAIYMTLLLVVSVKYRFVLRREIRITVIMFMFVLLAAIGLQLTFPRYLLTTSATALALTAMFFVMQSPADNVDPLTGAFNRVALMALLRRAYESGKDFTVITVSIRSLDSVMYAFGDGFTDRLLSAVAWQLGRMFPRQYVARPYVAEFLIIDTGVKPDSAAISETMKKLPSMWKIDKIEVELIYDIVALSGRDCSGDTQLINVIDSLIQRGLHFEEGEVGILSADACREYERESQLAAAIEHIIDDGMLDIDYQPIIDSHSRVRAVDTAVRITDERFSYASSQEIVHAAEQTGNIHALSEFVLKKVCEFIKKAQLSKHGIRCVCMRLSVVQCMRDGISALISGIVHGAGVTPGLICFEFSESASVSAYPAILENIAHMREEGFIFMLDNYGAGYTNSGLLSRLPVTHVRLDKLLMSRALGDEQHEVLFAGICDVISRLELTPVCGEIDSAAEARLLDRSGVTMRQGDYFFSFIPEAEMLKMIWEI